MTGFILKIVVLISYTLGNVAMLFVDGTQNYVLYTLMRSIGQMALPITCFLLVEGFSRTSSKKKYFIRLFGFGLLAMLPYIYMSMEGLRIVEDAIHTHLGPEYVLNSENLTALKPLLTENAYAYYLDIYNHTSTAAINGLMTLSVNLIMLLLLQKVREKYFGFKKVKYVLLTTLIMLATICVLVIFPFEEPILITLMVAMFYFLRGNKPALSVMMLLALVCFYTDMSLAYAVGAGLSIFLIFSYDGKEGSKKFKYLFYAYYPIHMVTLYFISTLVK